MNCRVCLLAIALDFLAVTICVPKYAINPISIIKTIKLMRWAGHMRQMGDKRTAYRLLVGQLEGKRPLGRPRRR
jgi:hypothetical protein